MGSGLLPNQPKIQVSGGSAERNNIQLFINPVILIDKSGEGLQFQDYQKDIIKKLSRAEPMKSNESSFERRRAAINILNRNQSSAVAPRDKSDDSMALDNSHLQNSSAESREKVFVIGA